MAERRPSLGFYATKVDHSKFHKLAGERLRAANCRYTPILSSVYPASDITKRKLTHVAIYLDGLVAEKEAQKRPVPEVFKQSQDQGIRLAILTPHFSQQLFSLLNDLNQPNKTFTTINFDARANISELNKNITGELMPWLGILALPPDETQA